jgi:glycosyltransferase involved in cell wall biosynthesis
MKIGWILSGNENVAGARIQGWNVHRILKQKGYVSEILYAPSGFKKEIELNYDEKEKILKAGCDVVCIQKFYDNEQLRDLINELQANKIKIVYICMDRMNKFLAEKADKILVVSKYLKDNLSLNDKKKAKIVFDGFEQNKNLYKKHTTRREIKLVYVSNNVYDVFPQIKKLPGKVKLRIIGPPKLRIKKFNPTSKIFSDTPYEFEYINWTLDKVTQNILDCDVGVLPYPCKLINTPAIRRKSNNRLIYLMSLGLPVIVSPTDEFKKLIKNGKNGFIATTEKEWENIIINLRDKPDFRKKVGETARKFVLEKYSLEKQVEIYEKILKSLK